MSRTVDSIDLSRFGIADPDLLMYIGVGAIGLAAVALTVILVAGSRKSEETSDVEERIKAYTSGGRRTAKQQASGSLRESATAKAQQVLANNKGLEAKIAARLDGSGSAFKPAEWVLVHAGIAMVSALILFALGGGNPALGMLGLLGGAVLPWVFLGMRRSRRLRAFQGALPETLQMMSGSLSAGLSLAQSIDTIVRESEDPVAGEFRRVVVESRLGVALEDAMEGVADRMQSRDFGWVVMAIRIQRDVGGNLAELLLTVAGTLREREYIRRHVRALSAEGRLSAYVLGGLPPAFLGYLALSRWEYVKPLFTEPIGYALLVGMVVMLSVGVFWMSKVAKVKI